MKAEDGGKNSVNNSNCLLATICYMVFVSIEPPKAERRCVTHVPSNEIQMRLVEILVRCIM